MPALASPSGASGSASDQVLFVGAPRLREGIVVGVAALVVMIRVRVGQKPLLTSVATSGSWDILHALRK